LYTVSAALGRPVISSSASAARMGQLRDRNAMHERVFEWLGWFEKHRVLAAWIAVALIVLLLGVLRFVAGNL
jgi:hypothetical protein